MTSLMWSTLYKILRGAIVTAFVQTVATQPDWSKPEVAIKTLAISFTVGFFLALGSGIREQWGNTDKSKGLINRALPI